MLIKAENTAAIIVDVQEKLMPAMFNEAEVEKNVNRLISGLKLLEVPMIVTQQYTKGIGMTIPSVKILSIWINQASVFMGMKRLKKPWMRLVKKSFWYAVPKHTYVSFRPVSN